MGQRLAATLVPEFRSDISDPQERLISEVLLMDPGVLNRPMTGRVWHMHDVLDGILERFGASSAAARLDSGEALLDARARCYRCGSSVACEQSLAAAAGDERAAYPQFCPNAAFIQRCLALSRAPQRPVPEAG